MLSSNDANDVNIITSIREVVVDNFRGREYNVINNITFGKTIERLRRKTIGPVKW